VEYILRQIDNLMWANMRECQLVSKRIFFHYHLLEQVLLAPDVSDAPQLGDAHPMFPIPTSRKFSSEREQTLYLRNRLELFVTRLLALATASHDSLEVAREQGGAAYSPNVVYANAATFIAMALEAKETCVELATQASQKIESGHGR
jgi:hypothetical protein